VSTGGNKTRTKDEAWQKYLVPTTRIRRRVPRGERNVAGAGRHEVGGWPP